MRDARIPVIRQTGSTSVHLARIISVLLVTVGFVASVSAQERARVLEAAPLYLLPDKSRVPLEQAQPGTILTVLRVEGAWLNVRWQDRRYGSRTGYIESRFVSRMPQSAQSAGPSPQAEGGPAAATARVVPTVTNLKSVRHIYVEEMENDLDQYIRSEILKELSGRVTVVLDKVNADGILRAASPHDNASASITLVDRDETVILWASEAGDRSLTTGTSARASAQRKVADRLVSNLKKALGK